MVTTTTSNGDLSEAVIAYQQSHGLKADGIVSGKPATCSTVPRKTAAATPTPTG